MKLMISLGLTFGGLVLFIVLSITYLVVKKVRLILKAKTKIGVEVQKHLSK